MSRALANTFAAAGGFFHLLGFMGMEYQWATNVGLQVTALCPGADTHKPYRARGILGADYITCCI